MVRHPSPTPFGHWLYRNAPPAAFVGALVGMLVSECLVPFFFLAPYPWCAVAAALTIGLMAGIQATGNFGHFNLLVAVLCVPLLDDGELT